MLINARHAGISSEPGLHARMREGLRTSAARLFAGFGPPDSCGLEGEPCGKELTAVEENRYAAANGVSITGSDNSRPRLPDECRRNPHTSRAVETGRTPTDDL